MKFWDASAVVPLLLAEPATKAMLEILSQDNAMLVWWATEVECASALARLEREKMLDASSMDEALSRLSRLAACWHEIEPGDLIRETAIRFLRVHTLRAADALQLAAAFIAADGRPSTLDLITLDERMLAAARKEGFATPEITTA